MCMIALLRTKSVFISAVSLYYSCGKASTGESSHLSLINGSGELKLRMSEFSDAVSRISLFTNQRCGRARGLDVLVASTITSKPRGKRPVSVSISIT